MIIFLTAVITIILVGWLWYTLSLALENRKLKFENKILTLDVEHYYRQYNHYHIAYLDEMKRRINADSNR